MYIQIFIHFSSFKKLLFDFHLPVTCSTQLNTGKHSTHKILQVFLLFVSVTRNTGGVTLYMNSLKPIFAKPVFNILLRHFT